MDELRIIASHGQEGYRFDAYDAGELFTRATALLNDQKCQEAVALYDKLSLEFPSSRFASAALYNAGLCLQALADFEGSAQRFTRLREGYPDSEDRTDASFQLAEVLVQLARWEKVVEVSDELLAKPELTAKERLEAMARRGQALLGQKRHEEAESYARGALAFFRNRPAGQPIEDEFFAAACNYVLAESLRERQEAMAFPSGTEAQKQVLLRRAELVLAAQREYLATIGYKNLTNYHWAAAAGYRIGSMYDELWRAVTSAPVPSQLSRAAQAEYHAQLGTLLRPLIRNAIRYWEATELSIERAGITTPWTERIRADLARVRALLLGDTPPGGSPEPPGETSAPDGSADPTPVTSPEHPPQTLHRRAARPPAAGQKPPVESPRLESQSP